jgi:hypothetical protein
MCGFQAVRTRPQRTMTLVRKPPYVSPNRSNSDHDPGEGTPPQTR